MSARGFTVQFCAGCGDLKSSGHRRLGEPDQVVHLGSRCGEPVIFGAKPNDLKLERPNLGTQLGDLVYEAPIGRAAYVAEEGLSHIVSLISAAGRLRQTRAQHPRPKH